jgi:hypothetical protein
MKTSQKAVIEVMAEVKGMEKNSKVGAANALRRTKARR